MADTRKMLAGCCVWAVVVCIMLTLPAPASGGCIEANLCCHGRNNTCTAKGPKMRDNSLDLHSKNNEESQCFCDESCLYQKDCCKDFKHHCKAVDCELGQWDPWTKCSKDCGWGQKTRHRDIITPARNGGTPCNSTEDRVSCYGWSCKKARSSRGAHEMRETGKIIPATFGTWRKSKQYNPYRDIRKNLFYHYSANQIIKRPAYCARFEVSQARSSCTYAKGNTWSRMLKKGAEVCVECQQLAMKRKLGVRCRGHGVFLKETRWNAFTVPGCHGKWVMKTRHEECSCNPHNELSFILV